jgi:preprotein translocase subunit YajC
MQPEATHEAVPGTGSTSSPSHLAGPGNGGMTQSLVLMGVMFVVFYFLLVRPQQKRQKELDGLLKALKKGDKVRTTGGIRGEIVELTDDEVGLLVAEKVKIHVLRSHIASKLEPVQGAEKSK